MANRPDIQYIQFYTDGSAARKLAPERSATKTTLPRPRRKKRKVVYVDPVAILGIVVAVCMLIAMAVGVVEFRNTQQEAARMERYLEQLKQENEQLSLQYSQGYDLETVERTALALGMVPAEQVAHIQLPATVQEPEAPPLSVWERIGTFLAGLFA